MPIMAIDDILKRHGALKQFRDQVLREGVDFGKIPGTGDKPTLLKPGAEKLCTLFGLTVRFAVEEKIEDWAGTEHDGEPLFFYLYRCSLWRGNQLIAEADGSANSRESKYRWRKGERTCPHCGAAAIIKGKAEYGGGWICFAKKGGCGAKFPDNAPEILEQSTDRVLNPDICDVINTLQKMAQKRALVAAALIGVNASEFFTQDIEDFAGASDFAGEASTPPRGHAPNSRQQSAPVKNGAPPAVQTPRFKELLTEAFNKKWAVENGRVNNFRLLNAIRAGGFTADAITNDNIEEARAAMRAHYDHAPQAAQEPPREPIPASAQASTQATMKAAARGENAGYDPYEEVLPRPDVLQSDEYRAFAARCDELQLDWRTAPGRQRFEETFSDLAGDLFVVADMAAEDFQTAKEGLDAGDLRW
jgi:hypothetical protein